MLIKRNLNFLNKRMLSRKLKLELYNSKDSYNRLKLVRIGVETNYLNLETYIFAFVQFPENNA